MLLKNKNDSLVAALGGSLGQSLEGAVVGRSPWADARSRFVRNRERGRPNDRRQWRAYGMTPPAAR